MEDKERAAARRGFINNYRHDLLREMRYLVQLYEQTDCGNAGLRDNHTQIPYQEDKVFMLLTAVARLEEK